MPLTHHPVRLFRLSCGCLRAYPMMPVGPRHEVLCVSCRVLALTVLVYPERTCGVLGWAVVDGERIRVACTVPRAGKHMAPPYPHYDELARALFTTASPRLTRGSAGKTGKA